jgi:hypothetical protein
MNNDTLIVDLNESPPPSHPPPIGKKRLIKIKNKNKNKFNELSFVENHVDTFYIGLNEPYQAIDNPKQGKVVPAAKDWVN